MNQESLKKLTEAFNLLSSALEKANAKGAFKLAEASAIYSALIAVKGHVESPKKPEEV